ncbi:hypothetical protein E4K10_42455 [Streptomyces sp. T1317-0309]|nr:hypothetical protein E4K10_42455 [Streptomyces sp. T1317-0309]
MIAISYPELTKPPSTSSPSPSGSSRCSSPSASSTSDWSGSCHWAPEPSRAASRYQEDTDAAWVGPVADYLADGLRETALLALVSIAASLLAGILLGALLTLPGKPVRAVVRAYVEIWRGLPIIITLFLIFFVRPSSAYG